MTGETESASQSVTGDRLGGDAPIETSDDDLLGFGAFAKALALGLVERAPDAGLVVGLQARWGMGKSSAVNLCLEHVRRLDTARPEGEQIVIQAFNPWFFSGVDALTTGYLSALTDAVEVVLGPRSLSLPQRTWRKVKTFVGGARDHSDAVGASAAGAVTLFSGGAVAPLSGAIKGTIVSALKNKPTADDLSKRFDKLVGRLTGANGRVLIVVDDLDRLQPSDLRQLLSIVKTFGNLPGVTHLLVYDRDIVDVALADARADQRARRLPSYREKIVQAEFDLPHATLAGLRGLLARGVDPLIAAEPDFDQMDWFYAAHLASDVYLRSPRDVVRFTNGLSIAWPSIAGEAYFPDFFVLELWRLFERDFYDGIRDHKEIVTGDNQQSLRDVERKKIVQSIVERVPEPRRSQVVHLFSRLFPNAARLLDNAHHFDRSKVEGRWRVGAPLGFEAYFRMCPPEDEYSQADLERIKQAIADDAALDVLLSDAMGRAVISGGTFLPKFLAALYQVTAGAFSHPIPLLWLVARRGDEILTCGKADPGMRWQHGREDIRGLARRCLLQIPSERRSEALREALVGAGASTSAIILAGQFEPHNMDLADDVRRRMEDSVLEADEARALADDFIAAVETDPGIILTAPVGWQVVSLWDSLRGPAPIKAWIDCNLEDPRVIIFVIDMIMSHVSSTIGEYRQLRGPVSWEFVDLRQLLEVASMMLAAGQFSDDQEELAKVFVRDASKQLDAATGDDADDAE
ncbi:KAP family P-loop NTPase fold protein [Sphingopyxis sp. RIFCSPHIGHO2_12_FULL_65_19]|uniref:KAP family P-loop NTPase fold protein n=1 Tax=Sphingopyxis sp. RIFCSPHIGHO2_12_FULL_65_19 TaxID=1802172 RepID=UPI0008B17FE8|nr:P-loop NTPase fold protein [Sphingopyxis sp. RIFCSPHIGHO2_12_FULL_65_19]OHD09882.1 MAG: hypothetical protein A3E77_11585 [Sphingopyxis sp. RIFCSPHIGHO2_12_FULL_65_19]